MTKTNNNTRIDKIKANQPSENPFFDELMSMSNADNSQDFAALLQKALTYEKAEVTFRFSDVFKGRRLAEKVGVSHETIYKWAREYAPEILRKYTKTKGGLS